MVSIIIVPDVILGFSSTTYTTTETAGSATVCAEVLSPPGGAIVPFNVIIFPEEGMYIIHPKMYWIKDFCSFLLLLSENDISGAQYTKECNVELEFTQGATVKCHSYHIVQDSVCEENENTTHFNLILSLTSTFGLNIDHSRSRTRVTIDDSGEPECNCKKGNLHIVKIIDSLYYPPDVSVESLGNPFNDAIIIAIIAPSLMIIFIVSIIMVIICNYQKLKKLHLDQ